MKKKYLFLIGLISLIVIIIFYPKKVFSENNCLVNIYGTVIDINDNPIEGVEVYYGTEKKATTDANGKYSIWVTDVEGATNEINYVKTGYNISRLGKKTISYELNDKYEKKKKVQVLFYGNDSSKNVYDNLINKKLNQSFSNLGINYTGKYVEDSVSINNAIEGLGNFNDLDIKSYVFHYATDGNTANLCKFLNQSAFLGAASYYDMFVNVDPNGNNLKSYIENSIKSKKIMRNAFEPMEMNDWAATETLNYFYTYNDSFLQKKEQIDTINNDKIEVTINKENDYELRIQMEGENNVNPIQSGEVEINSNINNTEGTPLENLDVEMNVYDSNDNFVGQIAKNINTMQSQYMVNLEAGKSYYIEYIFSRDAWNNGYSTQEYDVAEGDDSTTSSKSVRYAKNANDYTVAETIDFNAENSLDDYNNTKIIAKTNNFTIETYDEPIYEGGVLTGYDTKYTSIDANIQLKPRDDFNIELTKNVTNFRIVLQNGNTYTEEKVEGNPDFWSVADQKFIYMNTDIMYGAKVYIEYEIKIRNNGNTTNNVINILDYLNNYEGMTLQYNPDERLLSNPSKNNASQDWEIYSASPNINYGIESDVILENTFNVGAGEEQSKRLVVTQLLSTETQPTYENDVAVISYKNDQKQRNGGFNDYKRAGTTQLFNSSEAIYILIPFGGNLKD